MVRRQTGVGISVTEAVRDHSRSRYLPHPVVIDEDICRKSRTKSKMACLPR